MTDQATALRARPAPSLRSKSFGELEDTEMTPRDYLLTPWLREHESALIWAAAGVGKTMLTLSLALAVAGGGSVLGWEARTPRRVLIIDGEMPEDDLRDRLVALAGTVEGLDRQAARENLEVLARHGQHPDTDFPDFGDADKHDAILGMIRSKNPALVVLDNLSTLATLEDENSAAATQLVVRFLARLKQSRIAAIVVHHAAKGGTNYRGSTMLATTFEAIIGLSRDKGRDLVETSGTSAFDLKWDKFRGRRDATIGDRAVRLVEAAGDLRWTAELPQDEVLHALAALVRSGRCGSQQEVGRALPENLWPTPGRPPSAGWLSGQFALARSKKIITEAEIRAHFEAAKVDPGAGAEGPSGEPEADLGDDL